MGNIKLKCPSCGYMIDIKTKKEKCNTCTKVINAYTTLYEYKDYKKSLKLYMELYKEYPNNKDLLLGIILSISNEFSRIEYSLGERKSLIYYFDLYKKQATKEEINKYKDSISSIKDEINKEEKKDSNKFKKQSIGIASVIFIFILIYVLCLNAKAIKRNAEIRISDINTLSVDKLIKHNLLKCDLKDYKLEDSNLIVNFICGNIFRIKENYSFSYSYIDDYAPVLETSECKIKKGDKFDKSCIVIRDSVDGLITEYDIDTSEVNTKEEGEYYASIHAKDKSNNELSTEIKIVVE